MDILVIPGSVASWIFSTGWWSTILQMVGCMTICLGAIHAILRRLFLTLCIKICHLIRIKLISRWTIGLTHHLHLDLAISKVLNSRNACRRNRFSINRWMFSKFSGFIWNKLLLIKLVDSLVLTILSCFRILLIISNQNRLSKLVMLFLSDCVIPSSLTTLSLIVLAHINAICFLWWPLLEAKVLWNQRDIAHWLTNWLLLSHLHLSFWLISILNTPSGFSDATSHLASVRRRVVITNFCSLSTWLTLDHPILMILIVHHLEINARHFKVLIYLVDMLLVLLDLLLLHRHS